MTNPVPDAIREAIRYFENDIAFDHSSREARECLIKAIAADREAVRREAIEECVAAIKTDMHAYSPHTVNRAVGALYAMLPTPGETKPLKHLRQLDRHPIAMQTYKLVRAIDELPASEQATALVVQGSELLEAVHDLLDDFGIPPTTPGEPTT